MVFFSVIFRYIREHVVSPTLVANWALTEKHRAVWFSPDQQFLCYTSRKGQAIPGSKAGLFGCKGWPCLSTVLRNPVRFLLHSRETTYPSKACLGQWRGFFTNTALVCDALILDHSVNVLYEGSICKWLLKRVSTLKPTHFLHINRLYYEWLQPDKRMMSQNVLESLLDTIAVT